ncbi:hypothetical protein FRB99_002347 [Tulasnella sp. 403]|nr:hypothetical protein FRB99_002347 [Tulasnella sp. 403]
MPWSPEPLAQRISVAYLPVVATDPPPGHTSSTNSTVPLFSHLSLSTRKKDPHGEQETQQRRPFFVRLRVWISGAFRKGRTSLMSPEEEKWAEKVIRIGKAYAHSADIWSNRTGAGGSENEEEDDGGNDGDEATADKELLRRSFAKLLKLYPGLSDDSLDEKMPFCNATRLYDTLTRGMNNARSSDKYNITQGLSLPHDFGDGFKLMDKTSLVYRYHVTGELLCPVEFGWTPEYIPASPSPASTANPKITIAGLKDEE